MRWQNNIAITSLALNIILVVLVFTARANADTMQVYVPPLTKGTGYEIVIPNNMPTCNDIAARLGLKQGDVMMITRDEVKGTTITFKKDVVLDFVQVQTATNMIKGIMPKVEVK